MAHRLTYVPAPEQHKRDVIYGGIVVGLSIVCVVGLLIVAACTAKQELSEPAEFEPAIEQVDLTEEAAKFRQDHQSAFVPVLEPETLPNPFGGVLVDTDQATGDAYAATADRIEAEAAYVPPPAMWPTEELESRVDTVQDTVDTLRNEFKSFADRPVPDALPNYPTYDDQLTRIERMVEGIAGRMDGIEDRIAEKVIAGVKPLLVTVAVKDEVTGQVTQTETEVHTIAGQGSFEVPKGGWVSAINGQPVSSPMPLNGSIDRFNSQPRIDLTPRTDGSLLGRIRSQPQQSYAMPTQCQMINGVKVCR